RVGELTQRVLDRGGGGPHGLLFTLDGDGDLLGPVQGDRVAVRQRGALGGHDPVAVVELVAGRGEHRVQVAAEGRQLDLSPSTSSVIVLCAATAVAPPATRVTSAAPATTRISAARLRLMRVISDMRFQCSWVPVRGSAPHGDRIVWIRMLSPRALPGVCGPVVLPHPAFS